jgi:hypothetical protein
VARRAVGWGEGDHLAGEDLEAASAAFLGTVHCDVDALEKDVCADGLVGDGADADADGEGHENRADCNGVRQGRHDLLGDPFGVSGVNETVEQNDELVASHAGDAVGVSDDGRDAFRGNAQDLIAAVVAQGIVDLLEFVEVEHEQDDGLVEASGVVERVVEISMQESSRGKAGQRVVVGQVAIALPALAEFVGLLLDSAAEDDDPYETCCDGGEGDEQGEADTVRGPP